MTASLQPEPDDSVIDTQQLDVTTVRGELGADAVEGLCDPRTEVVRVEIVKQEEVGGQVVTRDRFHDREAGGANSGDVADQGRQGGTVEFEQCLDDLTGLCLRGRVGEALDLFDQRFNPTDPAAEVGVGGVHPVVTPGVESRT
ncbi:hypothetical protein EP7_000362 [Isosphaeraceae bacterium EP7]